MADYQVSFRDEKGIIYGPYSENVVTIGTFIDWIDRLHELDKSSTLVFPFSGVSKRHCDINAIGRPLTVRDHNKNGTFVNGLRVDEETLLRNRDILSLGGNKLTVVVEDI